MKNVTLEGAVKAASLDKTFTPKELAEIDEAYSTAVARKDEEGISEALEFLRKNCVVAPKHDSPFWKRYGYSRECKDREIAKKAGLLGLLREKKETPADVFGLGKLSVDIKLGGLRGDKMGDAGGYGGLGVRTSTGGYGLGLHGLGTYGHGRGTGGYGNIDLGGRDKSIHILSSGTNSSASGLAKEEIGRTIRRNLAKFKFAYERELNANPNLAGTVTVHFVIGPDGKVKAKDTEIIDDKTTLINTKVHAGILKVINSLVFPSPRNASEVTVTYPFVFKST